MEIFKCLDKINGLHHAISGLSHDSRKVTPGGMFFALDGGKKQGRKFIKHAIKNGAICVVVSKRVKLPKKYSSVEQIVVPDVREAMSFISKKFYNNVSDRLRIVGIVGTNGKTTCAHILRHIFAVASGKGVEVSYCKVGIIGTLGTWIGGQKVASELTTPDPIDLHNIFSQMVAEDVETVVMESSAHAIHLKKLCGLTFESAIFTNITVDHLDFFGTFDKYSRTKIDFFIEGNNGEDKYKAKVKTAIVNIDDPHGVKILEKRCGKSILYSLEKDAKNLRLYPDKSEFEHSGHKVTVNLPGRFNVYNALACLKCACEMGVDLKSAIKALATIPQVQGRYNTYKIYISKKEYVTAIIDYAHTPDGLEKVIGTARETCGSGNIITVFGCGGERDKTKRSIMGEISARLSDFTVITNDNPRGEKPMSIIKQIEKGIKNVLYKELLPNKNLKEFSNRYRLIEDRKNAIKFALDMANNGDVVIIAGKGTEETMEVNGKHIPFCDTQVVLEYKRE